MTRAVEPLYTIHQFVFKLEHKIYCTDTIWLLVEYCNKLVLGECQCLSYAGLLYMYWHQNKLKKVGNCIVGV